jgi:ketosteroid isomerase-like protein
MKPGKVRSNKNGPDAKGILDTWVTGYQARDVAKLMSVFDPELRYIAPCQPEQTFESLASWFRNDFGRSGPLPSWNFAIESVDASGDLAVIVSRWASITNYEGFSADVQRLRSVDFLRRGTEGWKIFRTINDPECCGPSPKAVKRPRRR